MASLSSNIEPQNERGHGYNFSPLPQSEPETDHDYNHEEDQPLSVFVESTNTRPAIPEYYYSEEIFSISARTCEMIQDLLGLTVFMMLIFLPLLRLRSPNEDPVPPVFVLNSMFLSNFTTGSEGLAATWDAKFTVKNINVSSIYFRSIYFNIFYKRNPEDALSATSSYPFYLDSGEYVKLHLKFTTKWEENNQPFVVENRLVEEMGNDKAKDGFLNFGMQMKVEAIYYGETWVSNVVMSPHCEDLTIQFFPDTNKGRLGNPDRNFSVPIKWKPFSFF